jgi:electron transfer flavoprotein beta subunit
LIHKIRIGNSKGEIDMNIVVLLKQVPDTTAKISVSGGRVDEGAVSKWSMSPYDEYALESALQLKEKMGGDLIAITCGPERCSKMLTDAAAVGADKLIHILNENELDSIQVQSLLASAVTKVGGEIILCGKQAADTNSGSTGPGVAELIGASCVTLVSEVNFEEGDISAIRLNSSGAERIGITTPCVFAFDKGVTELRRPNVRGIMMAKKKEITKFSNEQLSVDIGQSSVKLVEHSYPPEKPPGQKFEGINSIQTVIAKLRDEANVI